MEKFNYYFNTRSRIDTALSAPIKKSTMESILFNLIWDAYYNISHDEQVIVQYIETWMNDKTTIYHLSSYAKTIKKYIKKMKKMPWRDISEPIKVRKSELDYISSFDDIRKEKVLFCYLAVAKFKDACRKSPTHWEDESDTVIFKMAKVPIPAKDRDYFINDLIHGNKPAAIRESYKNDDTSKRIDYISDDESDPVVLELDEANYYELAFTYLNWKENGGYKKCRGCGRLFRVKNKAIGSNEKDNNARGEMALYCKDCSPKYEPKYKGKDDTALDYEPKKIVCKKCKQEFYLDNYMASNTYYCDDCRAEMEYVPMKTKIIICKDCGKKVEIKAKDNQTCRCEDCYKKYRLIKKTETMRKLRDKE